MIVKPPLDFGEQIVAEGGLPRDLAERITAIQARWRLDWAPHRGRHRYRLLPNAPHPVTGLPTFVGCEKCGTPQP